MYFFLLDEAELQIESILSISKLTEVRKSHLRTRPQQTELNFCEYPLKAYTSARKKLRSHVCALFIQQIIGRFVRSSSILLFLYFCSYGTIGCRYSSSVVALGPYISLFCLDVLSLTTDFYMFNVILRGKFNNLSRQSSACPINYSFASIIFHSRH